MTQTLYIFKYSLLDKEGLGIIKELKRQQSEWVFFFFDWWNNYHKLVKTGYHDTKQYICIGRSRGNEFNNDIRRRICYVITEGQANQSQDWFSDQNYHNP